jgi:hypothetical protein
VHFSLVIRPAELRRTAATLRAGAAPKELLEKIGEITLAEFFRKGLPATAKSVCAPIARFLILPRLFKLLGLLPVLAVLIVFLCASPRRSALRWLR